MKESHFRRRPARGHGRLPGELRERRADQVGTPSGDCWQRSLHRHAQRHPTWCRPCDPRSPAVIKRHGGRLIGTADVPLESGLHRRTAANGESVPTRGSCSAASAVDGLLETNEFHTGTKTLSQPPPSGDPWNALAPIEAKTLRIPLLSCRSSGITHGVPKTSAPTAAVVFTRIWTDGSELG